MGFFDNHGLGYKQKQGPSGFKREDLMGIQAAFKEEAIPTVKSEEEIQRSLEYGLEAAESIEDRTISCFSRGELPHYAGINTFLKVPFLEDVREVGNYDVAFMGVPFDIGTTYRPGTRFGPQAIRRISSLYTPYNYEIGVDLRESLNMCDLGDVFTIGNIEKSFDQITKAVSHVFSNGTMPIIFGGDHSIGFPCVRGVAENVEGNIGIIHLDRHADIQEKDMDERMHTTPWFHATNIPNAPAVNLVQVGIGGWQVPRPGVKVARERGTTILTINDVENMGIEKAVEIALEVAWKGAKAVYLSFDIDSVDCGFVPGTGWPEPGGFLPREALKFLQLVAREGICAMEVVEVSPPYDISDTTALLAARAALDVLATMVDHGKIGKKFATP
ncbi:agmatinase family protein [Effusibacillus lacus]|uniref:Agmatinase n=1 Tax=Effusibacillus lacus TaxID=1348429 RepID=A0A292YLR1_9BACL|nr:agmatinase family protein [Effusibacillus lacus]TCS71225.1 agmatinase [Effusibacillus lacus]GAX89851.1 agmatinase [Effusibacillus lacus]